MVKDATPVSRIKRPNGGSGFIRFQHPDASYRQYLGRNRRGNLERLDRLARAENLMVHGPDSRRVRLVKSLLESRISTWNEMKAAGSKSPSLAAGHDRFDARSMERLNERIAAARAENAAAQAKGAGVPKKPRRMSDATIQRNLDRLERLGYQPFRDAAKSMWVDGSGGNTEIRERIAKAAKAGQIDLTGAVKSAEKLANAKARAELKNLMALTGAPKSAQRKAVAAGMAENRRVDAALRKPRTPKPVDPELAAAQKRLAEVTAKAQAQQAAMRAELDSPEAKQRARDQRITQRAFNERTFDQNMKAAKRLGIDTSHTAQIAGKGDLASRVNSAELAAARAKAAAPVAPKAPKAGGRAGLILAAASLAVEAGSAVAKALAPAAARAAPAVAKAAPAAPAARVDPIKALDAVKDKFRAPARNSGADRTVAYQDKLGRTYRTGRAITWRKN